MRKLLMMSIAGAGAAAALLAACGSDNATVSAPNSSSAPSSATAQQATTTAVSAGTTDLGKALVDSSGRTLYWLSTEQVGKLACTGVCLNLWPAATVAGAAPKPSGGATATLAVFARPDGTNQLSVDGKPLHTYAGDSTAGDTNGEGVEDNGGTWHAVGANGKAITSSGAGSSPSPSSGGGGYQQY